MKAIEKLKEIISEVPEEDFHRLAEELKKAKRVFVAGAGSSRFASYIFATRLAHAGLDVHVVEETTLPFLRKNDMLLVLSGSGETLSCVRIIKGAKDIGCKVASITSYPNSTIGKLSDIVIKIKGREALPKDKDYLRRILLGEYEPLKPTGVLFEIAALLFLEGIISLVAEEK